MPTTYTASDQNAPARAYHVGVNPSRSVYQSTTTLSVSDIIFGPKIPHNSWVLDGYIKGTIDNAATVLKCGVAGVDNNLLTSGTFSATAAIKRFDSVPQFVSLSDDAATQFSYVFATVNANSSLTQSSSLEFVVFHARKFAAQ